MHYVIMFEDKPFKVFTCILEAIGYVKADPYPNHYSIVEVRND